MHSVSAIGLICESLDFMFFWFYVQISKSHSNLHHACKHTVAHKSNIEKSSAYCLLDLRTYIHTFDWNLNDFHHMLGTSVTGDCTQFAYRCELPHFRQSLCANERMKYPTQPHSQSIINYCVSSVSIRSCVKNELYKLHTWAF